jgi:hypothetical protein
VWWRQPVATTRRAPGGAHCSRAAADCHARHSAVCWGRQKLVLLPLPWGCHQSAVPRRVPRPTTQQSSPSVAADRRQRARSMRVKEAPALHPDCRVCRRHPAPAEWCRDSGTPHTPVSSARLGRLSCTRLLPAVHAWQPPHDSGPRHARMQASAGTAAPREAGGDWVFIHGICTRHTHLVPGCC